MDANRFEQIVKTFADREGDVVRDGPRLIADVYGESIVVELSTPQGVLMCTEEGGAPKPAWHWITDRLGRLELLARRIEDAIKTDEYAIPVEADAVDVLTRNPNATPDHRPDAVAAVQGFLDAEPAGTTRVVYLTSDAGEGKTTLINQLALDQAARYRNGQTSWLLMPVQLGGRPFLRLDDAIIGTLANQLRFRQYYYSTVVSLVQMGAIVLALDGFEEVFVETRTGEAVSSLGRLLKEFESQGRLLVAARSAYYKYNDFEAQAKLFDSLKGVDVEFAEVNLCRWGRDQFLKFAELVGLDGDGEVLYRGIADRIGEQGEDHPLLTRAVLARKLIETFEEAENRDDVIRQLTEATGEEYFDRFVSQLVEREVHKWIYRSTGEGAARPILTLEQHHAVLTAVAEEMWRSSVDALPSEVLDVVAEVVVEGMGLPIDVAQQTRIRLPQHALLRQDEMSSVFRFDHEEFRNYYLGRHLADLLGQARGQDLRAFLDTNVLPELTVRVAVERLLRVYGAAGDVAGQTLPLLEQTAKAGHRASYLRSSVGQIALALLSATDRAERADVAHLYVRAQHAELGRLSDVTFRDSVFERFPFDASRHSGLRFERCSVVNLVIGRDLRHADAVFDEQSVPAELSIVSVEEPIETEAFRQYDPDSIRAQLRHAGFVVGDDTADGAPDSPPVVDGTLVLVDRLLRLFQRATYVSDAVMATNLGTSWPPARHALDLLLESEVLQEVQKDSSGNQTWYRLRRTFDELEQARRISGGDHTAFLEALQR